MSKFHQSLLVSSLLLSMSLAFDGYSPDGVTGNPTGQQACYWEYASSSEAMGGTSSEGMTAARNGNSISTSFTHGGNLGCPDQVFQTTHTWTEPGSILTPGEVLDYSVSAAWSLDGTPSCTSLAAGVNTFITAGTTTIKAQQNQIQVSIEPSGSVSNSGSWIVPSGSSEGAGLTITAHGETGGLGGTVFYEYRYVCIQPTSEASETPEATEVAGDCFPKISGISNLTPGDVLSPSVDFVDEKMNPTGILGHAWLINGVLTPSTVWDGQETTVELQYTCLNHRGYTKTVVIPAYSGTPAVPPGGEAAFPGQENAPAEPPPESQPPVPVPGLPAGLPAAASVIGIAIGLAGAGISGAVIISNVLKTPAPPPPAAGKTTPPQQPPPKKSPPKKGKDSAKTAEEKKKIDLLEKEKEALKEYKETLESLGGNVEDAMEKIGEFEGLSPAAKKKLLEKLEEFKKSLEKVAKITETITDKLETLSSVREQIRSLAEQYSQIQVAHQEAFKDLKNVPEGAANQLADLTTAIETIGKVADASFSKIPIFNKIYSDEYFQVTDSFKQFAAGLRRNLARTIFRTATEAKAEFTPEELKQFGDIKENLRNSPEMQEFLRKNPRPEGGFLQQVKDLILGKPTDPNLTTFH